MKVLFHAAKDVVGGANSYGNSHNNDGNSNFFLTIHLECYKYKSRERSNLYLAGL